MKNTVLILLFSFLSVYGYGQQCTLSATISSSGNNICQGSSMVLTATATAGTAPYSYSWSTGENTASISVNKAGTYTVTVGDNTAGCQPVTQSITLTSSAAPAAPTALDAYICPNTSATLTATAPGGTYQWYDAPTGGNFLQSGDTYTTPVLSQKATYYVQTTVSGCTSPRSAVGVHIFYGPYLKNDTVCSGTAATLSASGADSYNWYDAPSGGTLLSTTSVLVTPILTSTTTFYLVSVIKGCTNTNSVVATVTPPPQTPTSSNITVCSGSPATLHASVGQGVIDWFDVPNGGTSLITSADFTTPPLTATTTYYAQTTLNGCVSARTPVTVTVNPVPAVPANQTLTVCPNTSTTLVASATPTGTYQWYDSPNGGTLLSNSVNYTTAVITHSTTYYLQNSNGSCSSPTRAAIKLVLSVPPEAPSVINPLACPSTSVTLTATAPGGTYDWYDAATNGNHLFTGASYTTPVLTKTTTFYVQTTVAGCTSTRSAVTVTVITPDAGPTASGATICQGSFATLSVSNPNASGTYDWYDSASGGNYLASGTSYVTPALNATTTYYVQTSTTNGCASARTAVTVTVTPTPPSPIASGTAVCPGSTETLTASAPSGTFEWYDAATGGNLLGTNSTYTTPPLTANTTYYVQNITASCPGPRTAVIASVINVANPQFIYPAGTFCPTGPNPKPTINNPAGGTFSASPAGLVFISTTTGQIDLALSVQGNYVVSFAGNGPCPTVTSAAISITTNPNSQFSYGAPYCSDGTDPVPTFGTGASAGTFTASPAGLVFANSSTGQVSLSQSTAGTYTVTNTIAASGSCPASSSAATIIIDKAVTVSAGNNQTITSGSTAQLAGSATGSSIAWSGGNGTFSNPSLPNAVYTPGAGETSAKLTLTTSNPGGPCGPKSATVTITIKPANAAPKAPTAAGVAICSGNSAVLTATAPGGTYAWFDVATGGTPLFTGPSFTTPPLTTSTTYYVQTTVGGQTSTRTAVTATINPTPASPTVTPVGTICQGTSATLTASGGSSATYAWYDAPTGGNLLSTNATYVTQPLLVTTTFYVENTGGGCTAPPTAITVTVNPYPNITSADADNICSGSAEAYTITADIPSATFTWGRAQVAGISNAAVTGQTSSAITETLINTTTKAINVTYVITPTANGCPGPDFNYVVTVYPALQVTSSAAVAACYGSPLNYNITFTDPTTAFTWSRAAVNGIQNNPVSGQSSPTIQEVLYNTTNAPVNVTYLINYNNSNCTGTPFTVTATVNPQLTITSAKTGTACSGVPQSYAITSNVPAATFTWSRAQVNGISNAAVTNQTSSTITESLVNTGTTAVNVVYTITALNNGCSGTPFTYTVVTNPVPAATTATSNSPVCLNSTVQLNTPLVDGASYLWTGPNSFTSTSPNPNIGNVTAAATGTYSVYVIVNGCTSPAATTDVVIDALPVAVAGNDQILCVQATSAQLAGSVTGGTTTGIWTTNGTGTFSPSADRLNAQYIPSAADKLKGVVTLTLASTSKDDCNPSISSLKITFTKIPGANAGPDQKVCSQGATATLAGQIFTGGTGMWSISGKGSGTFSPSPTDLNAVYIASPADIATDSVVLVLTATNSGQCYLPTDTMVVRFIPPPKVNAGGNRFVLKGHTITLYPTVSDSNVQYLWTPNVNISNNTIENPVVTGVADQTYTLTVTDSRGCVSSDNTFVKVSPQIIVPNTFTPNGDGYNDDWNVSGLIAYTDAIVDVFNRYGQKVFHSIGYPKNWDGTYAGKKLPAGVYYYIIDVKILNQKLSGPVTIIR